LDLSGVHDYAYVLLGEVNNRIDKCLFLKFIISCDRNQSEVHIEVIVHRLNLQFKYQAIKKHI